MRGDHVPHVADGHVAEVLGGAQQQVGAPALIVALAVPLPAGPARQEQPPLQRVAPAGGFVNEVAWGARRARLPDAPGRPSGPRPPASWAARLAASPILRPPRGLVRPTSPGRE